MQLTPVKFREYNRQKIYFILTEYYKENVFNKAFIEVWYNIGETTILQIRLRSQVINDLQTLKMELDFKTN